MSESGSESEPEDSRNISLFYAQRLEWSDVVPIKQDDGPNPVVRIAYSDRFSETFDYIRACMKSNEMSERALDLTKDACERNPANYTIWCYRRQLLFHLKSDLREELTFIGRMIHEHPKNYQVWEHRRLIVERSGHISHELAFLAEQVRVDSKNYHSWQYRQWLLKTYSLWSDELNYVDQLLDGDIRNNSGWNQRYFVIAHTTGFKDDIIERELDYAERRIRSYPDNESAWNYLRGVARLRLSNDDQRIFNFCQDLYTNEFEKDTLHPQQWRFLLAYMIELLMDNDDAEKRDQNKRRVIELCDRLTNNIDPIRSKYWRYIKEQHTSS